MENTGLRWLLLWLGGAGVAVVAILAAHFGLIPFALSFALVFPLADQRDGRVAVSGLLTGFGLLWLSLLASQSASGGSLDDATFWTTVGIVPLVLGMALLAIAILRRRVDET